MDREHKAEMKYKFSRFPIDKSMCFFITLRSLLFDFHFVCRAKVADSMIVENFHSEPESDAHFFLSLFFKM